MVWWDIQ